MLTQEQRDEAARLMGWEPIHRHPEIWYCAGHGKWMGPVKDWKPDEVYDHAMMLRDRCVELGLKREFVYALHGLDINKLTTAISTNTTVEMWATTTPKQITLAAMKTLKENQ